MPRNSLESIHFVSTASLKAMFSGRNSMIQFPAAGTATKSSKQSESPSPKSVLEVMPSQVMEDEMYRPRPSRPRTRRLSAATHEVITAATLSSSPALDSIPESPEPEFEDAGSIESECSMEMSGSDYSDSDDSSAASLSVHKRDSGVSSDYDKQLAPSPPRSPTIDELVEVELKEAEEALERRTALDAERLQFMISEEEAKAFEHAFSMFLNRQLPESPNGARKSPLQRHRLNADDFCSYMS
ncbi:UNVERIFIED_CONTAM: hypothetical protein HDU68_012722 [Siphonaria sp. JEL0065]|nr:hypothetical protein HDU68_012722 [Siphonaria sp. JEL0065]